MKSLLLDPSLRKRLEKAAKTLGASNLEELAVALLDAGYFGRDAKSPLEVLHLSRDEVGASLLANKEEDAEDPDFFRKLIPGQQHAVIIHLMMKGNTAQNVAGRFWVPVEEVLRIWNRYSARIGEDVLQIRFESFLGNLALKAEHCYGRALELNQPKQAADIIFKLYDKMQDLGVLYRAPVKHEHSMSEETRKAVDEDARRIVELQDKMKPKELPDGTNAGTNPPAPS